MENSLKYSSPESAVTVSLSKQGRGALLKVSNEVERPLTKDELAKIFDRFYRVDKSRSRKSGNMGLGLALCDQIAKIHHAHMEIESKPGEGTKVTFVYESFTKG